MGHSVRTPLRSSSEFTFVDTRREVDRSPSRRNAPTSCGALRLRTLTGILTRPSGVAGFEVFLGGRF